MANTFWISLIVSYIALLRYSCKGLDVPIVIETYTDLEETKDSSEDEQFVGRRHAYRHPDWPVSFYTDHCHCRKESCVCCFAFWKYRVCNILNLIEVNQNNKTDWAIDLEVLVNKKTVFTDVVPLTQLPSSCQRYYGFDFCAHVEARHKVCTQPKAQLCLDLELFHQKKKYLHWDVFCLKIEHKHRCDEVETKYLADKQLI